MTNLKGMVVGRLYVNRFSTPDNVYKKCRRDLLWYRKASPKTAWKLSSASGTNRNFILLTDYGYQEDADIFKGGFGVTNLRVDAVGRVPPNLMAMPL